MNYNNKQLCEIYYLFHEYDQECVKQISNDYPELLNYSNILRMICFQLRIFVGEYPDWYESRYYFTHLPFTITHHNISVYTMSELFKVLAQLKPEQLSFINDDFIRGIGSHYSHLFIDKFKMAVVPSQMVEENTHQYIDDFELMLSDELWNLPRIEYNGLNNISENEKYE